MIKWVKDPNWPAYDPVDETIGYEIWGTTGVYEVFRRKTGEGLAVYNTLEEAQQFVEMHWATGASGD